MVVVYIDILFLVNLIFDSILIVLTARISGKTVHPVRVLLGGLLGGLYGVSVFFALFDFLSSGILLIAISALIIFTVFFPFTKREFFRLIGGLYLSAFLLGGALSAILYFAGKPGIMSNGIYYFPLSLWQLLIAALPLAAMLCSAWKKAKSRLLSFGKYCKLILTVGQTSIFLEGILDTGCVLTDPYTSKPVIVIDKQAADKLLAGATKSLRILPFSTVNSTDNLASAFTPDSCRVITDSAEFGCICSVVISPAPLNGRAIINPSVIMNWRTKNELQIPDEKNPPTSRL